MTEKGTEVFVRKQYKLASKRLHELDLHPSTKAARKRAFDVGLAASLAACEGRGLSEEQAVDVVLLGVREAVNELAWPQDIVAIVRGRLGPLH